MVNRRSTPGLAEAVADRKALWPEGSRDWTGATLAYAGARRAGYGEVGVVWQDLEERVLAVIAEKESRRSLVRKLTLHIAAAPDT